MNANKGYWAVSPVVSREEIEALRDSLRRAKTNPGESIVVNRNLIEFVPFGENGAQLDNLFVLDDGRVINLNNVTYISDWQIYFLYGEMKYVSLDEKQKAALLAWIRARQGMPAEAKDDTPP